MKNYINLRLQVSNHYKEKNDIKHNFGTVDKLSNTTESQFSDYEETNINYGDMPPLKKLREWRKLHNERFKANRFRMVNGKKVSRGENLKEFNSTIVGGILSFSEAINRDLGNKYSKAEYEKACIEAVEKVAEEMETEVMYVSFHYREKTPHCHFHLRNFDDEGKSIFHKNKKKEQLSKLQDIAFSSLGKLGMDRGQSKEITNKNHQTTKAYYSKLYAETQNALRTQVTELKGKRKELSKVCDDVEKIKLEGALISEEQKSARAIDKILEKAKKGIAITYDEAEILKSRLSVISELIPKEAKANFVNGIQETIRNAKQQGENNGNS